MELKPLNKNAIASAIEKANHYRLLNDPENAESICRDVLEHDSDHQPALITLVLALADQIGHSMSRLKEARKVVGKLGDEYSRVYYAGIVCERAARGTLIRATPGCKFNAYDLFREAMENYEKADDLSSDANDDGILRWNSCLRTIRKRKLVPRPEDNYVPYGD